METSSRVDAALGAGKGFTTGASICQAAEIKEEEKWYVNPMVETSDQYFDMCTPQRGNPLFSMCTPAVRGSLEWMRTSFTDMRSSDTSRLPSLAEFLGDSPVQVLKIELEMLSKTNSSPYQELVAIVSIKMSKKDASMARFR